MMLKTGLFVSLLVTIFISYNIQNEYYPDGLSQPLLMKTVFYTTGIVNSIVCRPIATFVNINYYIYIYIYIYILYLIYI